MRYWYSINARLIYFLFYPCYSHSHVSLLIHMGFSAVAIGKRVEHVTYYYAHMSNGVQEEMTDRLDDERR